MGTLAFVHETTAFRIGHQGASAGTSTTILPALWSVFFMMTCKSPSFSKITLWTRPVTAYQFRSVEIRGDDRVILNQFCSPADLFSALAVRKVDGSEPEGC